MKWENNKFEDSWISICPSNHFCYTLLYQWNIRWKNNRFENLKDLVIMHRESETREDFIQSRRENKANDLIGTKNRRIKRKFYSTVGIFEKSTCLI